MNASNMPSFLKVQKRKSYRRHKGMVQCCARCQCLWIKLLPLRFKVGIYIILLAALSLSLSKPVFSFFCFWKIRRIRVISRTFDHIPAMIVVLKLQFVMSEMLEDFTQECRGRGNQIFEPSTLWDVLKHMPWSPHRFDLDLMPHLQRSGSSRSCMVFQRTSNSCRFANTRPGSRYPTHWELGCEARIEFWYLSCFRLITHYATVGLSFHDGDCYENMFLFLWLRPCMCRNLYVKGTHLEREQSW